MKKFAILAMALSLSALMLVGCGCMNTGKDVPTLPTNGETSTPTTHATTVPTTQPTTAPTTAPTQDTATETTGILDGTMDDIMGGSADDATVDTGTGRSRGRIMPRG